MKKGSTTRKNMRVEYQKKVSRKRLRFLYYGGIIDGCFVVPLIPWQNYKVR